MRTLFRLVLTILALSGFIGVAQAQVNSITTLFTGGNNGSSLWTVYFDVNVTNASGISIIGFDVNSVTASGTSFNLDFYTTALGGTYVGNDNVPASWTLRSSSLNGTTAGSNLPSHVNLPSPVPIAFGTQGFALRYNGVQPSYTNGTGSNQFFSNTDLSLTLGAVRSTTTGPFTGGTFFSPRVWNGTIYYTVAAVPEPTTLALFGVVGVGALGVGWHRYRTRRLNLDRKYRLKR